MIKVTDNQNHSRVCTFNLRQLTFILLIVLIAVAPYTFQIVNREVIVFRDLTAILYPLEITVRRIISNDGWLAHWNPFACTGKPLAAEPLSFLFYPPHIISRFFPLPYAIYFVLLSHQLIAISGMYALSRQVGLSKMGSVVAAITYSNSGYFLSCENMTNALYSVSWFPLCMYFGLRVLSEGALIHVLLLSFTIALTFLGGMPEVILFEFIALFLLYVDRVVLCDDRVIMTRFFRVAIATIISWGLVLPQLLLLVQYFRASGRRSIVGIDQFASNSFDFVGFFVPDSLISATGTFVNTHWWNHQLVDYPWAITLYCGPIVLSALMAVFLKRGRYWIVVALGCFLLSLGKKGGVLPLLHGTLPIVSSMRYPEKMLLGVHVLLSIGCGYAVSLNSFGSYALFIIGLVGLLNYFSFKIVFILVVVAILIYLASLYKEKNNLNSGFNVCNVFKLSSTKWSDRLGIIGYFKATVQILILLIVHINTYPLIKWDELIAQPRLMHLIKSQPDYVRRLYVNNAIEKLPPDEVGRALWYKNNLYQAWSGAFGFENINTPSSLNLRQHNQIQQTIAQSSKSVVATVLSELGVDGVVSSFALHNYSGLEECCNVDNKIFFYRVMDNDLKKSCRLLGENYDSYSKWSGEVECDRAGEFVVPVTHYPGWQIKVDSDYVDYDRSEHGLIAMSLKSGRHTIDMEFVSYVAGLGVSKIIALVLWISGILYCLLARGCLRFLFVVRGL